MKDKWQANITKISTCIFLISRKFDNKSLFSVKLQLVHFKEFFSVFCKFANFAKIPRNLFSHFLVYVSFRNSNSRCRKICQKLKFHKNSLTLVWFFAILVEQDVTVSLLLLTFLTQVNAFFFTRKWQRSVSDASKARSISRNSWAEL